MNLEPAEDAVFNKPATESQFRDSPQLRMERDLANCKRTLQKAQEALIQADVYFEHQAIMNAAAHCASEVMHTPLRSVVRHALVGISMYDSTYGLTSGDDDA